jgi:hypothetical protein
MSLAHRRNSALTALALPLLDSVATAARLLWLNNKDMVQAEKGMGENMGEVEMKFALT